MSTNKHRVQQIRDLPEAGERPSLAAAIAMRTTCSVSEAQQILRAAPVELDSPAATGRRSDAAEDDPASVVEYSSRADGDDDDVRQLIRAVGLKGFRRNP
jgi:hypothetical protein